MCSTAVNTVAQYHGKVQTVIQRKRPFTVLLRPLAPTVDCWRFSFRRRDTFVTLEPAEAAVASLRKASCSASSKNASSGLHPWSVWQWGQYETFMILRKDGLCSILVSMLVANDLFLIGHKMRRKGIAVHSVGQTKGQTHEMQCQRAAPAC